MLRATSRTEKHRTGVIPPRNHTPACRVGANSTFFLRLMFGIHANGVQVIMADDCGCLRSVWYVPVFPDDSLCVLRKPRTNSSCKVIHSPGTQTLDECTWAVGTGPRSLPCLRSQGTSFKGGFRAFQSTAAPGYQENDRNSVSTSTHTLRARCVREHKPHAHDAD